MIERHWPASPPTAQSRTRSPSASSRGSTTRSRHPAPGVRPRDEDTTPPRSSPACCPGCEPRPYMVPCAVFTHHFHLEPDKYAIRVEPRQAGPEAWKDHRVAMPSAEASTRTRSAPCLSTWDHSSVRSQRGVGASAGKLCRIDFDSIIQDMIRRAAVSGRSPPPPRLPRGGPGGAEAVRQDDAGACPGGR